VTRRAELVNPSVPVLVIAHRRSEHVRELIRSVAHYLPRKLFIAFDGWAPGDSEMEKECRKTREIAIAESSWAEYLETDYAKHQMGLRARIVSAIDWVFESEDRVIILEEDCLPSLLFFEACEKLLPALERDMRIGQISGHTFAPRLSPKVAPDDITFSPIRISDSWGWATWKSRWVWFHQADSAPTLHTLNSEFRRFGIRTKVWPMFWSKMYRKSQSGEIDSWAFHWARTLIQNRAYSLIPSQSLVKNMGHGPGSTHFKAKQLFSLTESLPLANVALDFDIRPANNLDAKAREFITAVLGPKIYGAAWAAAARLCLSLLVKLRKDVH
jgi:hypothetical protein